MPFTALFVITTTWVWLSRNNICFMEPRLMFLLFGTIFSNICVSSSAQPCTLYTIYSEPLIFQCRLIVAQMSDTRTEAWNTFFWPLLVGVTISIFPYPYLGMKDIHPEFERWVVYVITSMLTIAHIHYGQGIVSFVVQYPTVSDKWFLYSIDFRLKKCADTLKSNVLK